MKIKKENFKVSLEYSKGKVNLSIDGDDIPLTTYKIGMANLPVALGKMVAILKQHDVIEM